MKSIFLILISLIFILPASAQMTNDAVLQAQKRRFDATIAQNWTALDQVLADDMLYTHSNAQIDNKAQLMTALKSKKTVYKSIQPDALKVRLYGTVGIVNGTAKMMVVQDGKEQTINLRFTDTYANRDGQWKFVNWQSTRLPE